MSSGAGDGVELSCVEVDGVAFRVTFRGFCAPLSVLLDDGLEVTLEPWTCADHLRALAVHVTVHDGALALDPDGLAGEVLACSGLAGPAAEAIRPLALWWAAGGAALPSHHSGEWIDLGAGRVRLRAWTFAERLRALREHTRDDALDLVGYLGAMLAASVAEVEPRGYDVQGSDAAATAALLDAVIALDVLDPDDAVIDDRSLAAREHAATTLRLCRALGWTPSQVHATPALEVDRLLGLLDRLEAPAVPRGSARFAHGRAFAGHSAWVHAPDAVVIRIEEGG